MQEEQKRDLLVVITTLAEFYNQRISEIKLELYWRHLKHYALEDIQKVADKHCGVPDTGQKMPLPADLIRYLSGSYSERARKAWSKVEEAIHRLGAYSSVVFDDTLIHAVIVDMGGWVSLCQTPMFEKPFRRRDFENRYYDFLLKPPRGYLKKLTGILDSRLVQLIGDEKKALQVLQNGECPLKLLESRTITSLLLPAPTGEEHE